MKNSSGPMERERFVIQELMDDHPPRWRHPHKLLVFEIACPPSSDCPGEIGYSRWRPLPLPDQAQLASVAGRALARPGFFDYLPESGLDGAYAVEWHVNFADPHLFVAYGTSLFAQDEMQVAEHPSLGSLREALDFRQLRALTEEHGRPTPILVTGVPRNCQIATEPNADEGRPRGLYGNAFSRADAAAIRRATKRIEPPSTTNLIAMAALSCGTGPYRAEEIELILVTTFTAFDAAVQESARQFGPERPVVVHTGFWGCGAFGGNRVLMTTLQILAAGMARVERVVIHTGDSSGAVAFEEAMKTLSKIGCENPAMAVSEIIRRLHALGFEWGTSDGN